MRKTFRVITLSAALFQTSCTTIATHFPGVYAIDVDQGNIIDQEMIDQLRPDMNKRQVLYVLGTPMLANAFQKERWDYVFSVQPGSEDRLQKRMTLFFKDDKLSGVQGDFRPSSLPVISTSKDETVNVPKRDLDKTFFEKIAGIFSSDDPEQTSASIASDEAETDVEKLETETSPENTDVGTNNTDAPDNSTDLVIPVETESEISDELTEKKDNPTISQ